jgi:hypothetical protein
MLILSIFWLYQWQERTFALAAPNLRVNGQNFEEYVDKPRKYAHSYNCILKLSAYVYKIPYLTQMSLKNNLLRRLWHLTWLPFLLTPRSSHFDVYMAHSLFSSP